jgi:hypothetical protein
MAAQFRRALHHLGEIQVAGTVYGQALQAFHGKAELEQGVQVLDDALELGKVIFAGKLRPIAAHREVAVLGVFQPVQVGLKLGGGHGVHQAEAVGTDLENVRLFFALGRQLPIEVFRVLIDDGPRRNNPQGLKPGIHFPGKVVGRNVVVSVHHVDQGSRMPYQGLAYHLRGINVPGLERLFRILHLGIDAQDGYAMLPAEIQDVPPGIPVVGPFARVMDLG